jgi:excisionase family DNA binding protein
MSGPDRQSPYRVESIPALLSVAQCAQLCGVVPGTIRALCKRGQLRACRFGRELRISGADLVDYLNRSPAFDADGRALSRDGGSYQGVENLRSGCVPPHSTELA